MANYRNPGPRRGEPRVGSGPDVAFPLDPLDPVDPLQNSVRLIFIVKNVFCQFLKNWGAFLVLTVKKPTENPCFWLRNSKNLRKIKVFGFEP